MTRFAQGPPHGARHRFRTAGTIDRQTSVPSETESRPFVFDAGTLVLDLVDGRCGILLWRGWAEGSLQRVVDNQASLDARVGEAVTAILR